ncbi:uncharacterized protein [Notamacropus eugenii]|uniref:uncharacterized protein n=1 Tax=Notamacropus eugenii TaxID=9315 RepID=UPI003B67FB59
MRALSLPASPPNPMPPAPWASPDPAGYLCRSFGTWSFPFSLEPQNAINPGEGEQRGPGGRSRSLWEVRAKEERRWRGRVPLPLSSRRTPKPRKFRSLTGPSGDAGQRPESGGKEDPAAPAGRGRPGAAAGDQERSPGRGSRGTASPSRPRSGGGGCSPGSGRCPGSSRCLGSGRCPGSGRPPLRPRGAARSPSWLSGAPSARIGAGPRRRRRAPPRCHSAEHAPTPGSPAPARAAPRGRGERAFRLPLPHPSPGGGMSLKLTPAPRLTWKRGRLRLCDLQDQPPGARGDGDGDGGGHPTCSGAGLERWGEDAKDQVREARGTAPPQENRETQPIRQIFISHLLRALQDKNKTPAPREVSFPLGGSSTFPVRGSHQLLLPQYLKTRGAYLSEKAAVKEDQVLLFDWTELSTGQG